VIGRVIHSDACVQEGIDWLIAREPRFRVSLENGPLPLRLKPDGFDQLLAAIVSQQVSVASANAIWSKMIDGGMTTRTAVLGSDETRLRALGLSRQKAIYARALAEADIDFEALRTASNGDVIKELTAIKGIGTWTAEIYAMFSLGRADVFASGDLALQEAARIMFGLSARPTERQLRVMAEDWSPWRSVAARALWAYYRIAKSREGIV
jgi:DNA-3-methyladenine glycosylase II